MNEEKDELGPFTAFVAASTILTVWVFWLTIVGTIAYDWYRG